MCIRSLKSDTYRSALLKILYIFDVRAAIIVILFIISRFLMKSQHPIDTLFDVTHPFTLNILTCSALYICAFHSVNLKRNCCGFELPRQIKSHISKSSGVDADDLRYIVNRRGDEFKSTIPSHVTIEISLNLGPSPDDTGRGANLCGACAIRKNSIIIPLVVKFRRTFVHTASHGPRSSFMETLRALRLPVEEELAATHLYLCTIVYIFI
ncbi:unnamed protein product, partial [Trichogramma brassicae]